MDKLSIKKLLESFNSKREQTIVIIDYGNVEKWKNGLGWKIGIRELAQLVKNFAFGKQFLRRFYYGEDCGPNEKRPVITEWSKFILESARNNRFEVIKKQVKYIHSQDNKHGFEKKCDLDVEMAVDLIEEIENYDNIILFSGDGDLMRAIKHLKYKHNKTCYVFGARGHVGREVYDAKTMGYVEDILYAEDFEYRLNPRRF